MASASTKAKPADSGKDVATTGTGAVSTSMPDFMKQYAGQGGEAVRTEDLLIPRIALLQALSPQVTEQGEKVGEFYHTVLEESLGAEVKIIPLLFKKMLILWNPRENGGGILARSDDGKVWNPSNQKFTVKIKGRKEPVVWETKGSVAESGLTDWGTSNPDEPNSPPAATEVYSFLSVLPDHLELGPVVVALQRSQTTVAKKWLSRLMISQAPFFGQQFTLTSSDDQNKAGDKFKNFAFKPAGLVTDEALFNELRAMYARFKDVDIGIKDAENMQNDDPDANATAAAAEGKVSEKF